MVVHLACLPTHCGAYPSKVHSFVDAFPMKRQLGAQEESMDEEWALGQLLVVVATVPYHQTGPSSW